MKRNILKKEFCQTLLIISIAIIVKILYHLIVDSTFIGKRYIIGAYLQNHALLQEYPPIIWFIPCMFVAKFLFQMILRIFDKNNKLIFVSSSFLCMLGACWIAYVKICLPGHIPIAFLTQGPLVGGYLYKEYEEEISEYDTLFLSLSSIIYTIFISVNEFSADLAQQ